MLLDTDIKIYSISAREKDPKKLSEKIQRKEKEGVKYSHSPILKTSRVLESSPIWKVKRMKF